jgi:hypothetical protein
MGGKRGPAALAGVTAHPEEILAASEAGIVSAFLVRT